MVDRSVGARRLLTQQLAAHTQATPAGLVAFMGAVQAQDYGAAKWALGARLAGSTDASVDAAIDSGQVIRTHALRGTWHLVAPADVRWLTALVAARVASAAARRHRDLGLDTGTLKTARTAMERALRDGQALTRADVGATLAAAGVLADGQRLPHLLAIFELEALLCTGPRSGNQHTWMLLDHRVPSAHAQTPDDPAVELAQRYVQSRWPATVDDFVWWSGLEPAVARRAFGAVAPPAIDDALLERAARSVHVLPAFDEFLVAYRSRDDVLDPKEVERVNAGGGLLAPCIVADGRVVATWRRTVQSKRVDIEVSLFPGEKSSRALQQALRDYAAFVGQPAEIKLTSA